MAESVSVRCPDCRREHTYASPSYPCACGRPLTLPLLAEGVPVRVVHRTWAASWVTVRCTVCHRLDEWPQPELGCGCGTTVRVPVATPAVCPQPPELPHRETAGQRPDALEQPTGGHREGSLPPSSPTRRPPFRPVTIRTATDAKAAAAQYLSWLGFDGVRVAGNRPASGVDLRGPRVVAHVDPTTTATALREIETLWLNGLNESAVAVSFSLAGYSHEARNRADELALALFVLDLTGTPQPVNDAAEELVRGTA